MDNIIKNEYVTLFNPRGALRKRPASEVPYLKSIGWKLVVNAKREYAPELDMENKNSGGMVVEEMEEGNILKFEDV